jgi:chromosome partitioning protein
MWIVSVIGQKGGSGKTTLSCHLAAAATAAGLATAAIDTDPQKSLYEWYQTREADQPEVTRETDADELRKLAGKARKSGCQALIIDTSGRAEATMREAADLADIVLIPVKPEAFDIRTLPTVWKVIRFTGKERKTFAVLNQLQPLARGVTGAREREVREGIAEIGLQVAPVALTRLQSFTASLNDGRVAAEFEPAGRAAAEMASLFQWLQETLHNA